MTPLTVALLDRDQRVYTGQLAEALRERDHDARILGSHDADRAEMLLVRRGFTPGLSHAPRAAMALLKGGFDLTHAFSVPDAVAALAWRRLTGRPVIFTCAEVLSRATVADRRLRLWGLKGALEGADAVVAASDEASAGLERWAGVRAPVVFAHDAGAYEAIYRGRS